MQSLASGFRRTISGGQKRVLTNTDFVLQRKNQSSTGQRQADSRTPQFLSLCSVSEDGWMEVKEADEGAVCLFALMLQTGCLFRADLNSSLGVKSESSPNDGKTKSQLKQHSQCSNQMKWKTKCSKKKPKENKKNLNFPFFPPVLSF